MCDEPPTGSYLLASHYLLEKGRLRRRETTVDIYLSEVGSRSIDVECSLPNYGWGKKTWYLPLAFFPKDNVAPALEVTNGDGENVPIPTKSQNLALTCQAIDQLIVGGQLKIPLGPLRESFDAEITLENVRKFIAEIITADQIYARARRTAFDKAFSDASDQSLEVIKLLRRLEDTFVLWVPAEGEPQSHHQFRICRQEIRPRDEIIARKREEAEWSIETALGPVDVEGLTEVKGLRGLRIRFKALYQRLPNALAVRTLEASAFDPESSRAGSCHVRVNAPPGFLVRNVRAGKVVLPTELPGYSEVEEFNPREAGVVIQGWDQNLAHVQLFKEKNPEEIYCAVTLGPRGGAISLWMLTSVLTAVLLWVVYHHFKLGPPDFHEHVRLISWTVGGRGVKADHHLAIGGNEKQIAAAVLLVGPAFASAWSLRAEGGELLRSFLAGARLLLLFSAALSVAAALAFAGLMPFHIEDYDALQIDATISYLLAMPMVGAWLLSRDTLWVLFRIVFCKQRYNLAAVVSLALAVIGVCLMKGCPDGVTGAIVAGSGLGLALIGANSAGQRLRLDRKGSFYRTIAGFGSIPIIILGGSFLGFYGSRLPTSLARPLCVGFGIAIALFVIGWVIGKNFGYSKTTDVKSEAA